MPQVGAEAGKAAAIQPIDALMPRSDAAFILQELNAWLTYQPSGRILWWCPLGSP
jgi:hypothetical protein